MEIPATMKAVRFHEHGGLDVLKYEDAPVPAVGPNDALVKVKCCALNHLDLWIRVGARGWKIPMPHIVGADVSGVLVAVGSEVRHVEPGMECFVHPGVPGGPSQYKFAGDDNIAPDYGVLGVFTDGGRRVCRVRAGARRQHPAPAREPELGRDRRVSPDHAHRLAHAGQA